MLDHYRRLDLPVFLVIIESWTLPTYFWSFAVRWPVDFEIPVA